MIILGIDPGIGRCGFGVINTASPEKFVRCGMFTTPPSQDQADRLHTLAEDLEQLIIETNPDVAVVEELFFGKNHKTAIQVAQARGVILYVLRKHHITIQSLTPLQIKSRLTGYGAATKNQVQSVVQSQLHLSAIPQPDDAADALAAALCAA